MKLFKLFWLNLTQALCFNFLGLISLENFSQISPIFMPIKAKDFFNYRSWYHFSTQLSYKTGHPVNVIHNLSSTAPSFGIRFCVNT